MEYNVVRTLFIPEFWKTTCETKALNLPDKRIPMTNISSSLLFLLKYRNEKKLRDPRGHTGLNKKKYTHAVCMYAYVHVNLYVLSSLKNFDIA